MTDPTTTAHGDPVEWLRRQLAIDERLAQSASDSGRTWTAAIDVGDHYNIPVVTPVAVEKLQKSDSRPLLRNDPTVARCQPHYDDDGPCAHIAEWDPQRVLAEVEAKRRIVDLHEGEHACSTYDRDGNIDNCTWVIGYCSTLRLLALPYADRAGYRKEWGL